MVVIENGMEEWKLLSFLALLSNYDFFSVQKNDDPIFYATGIDRSCGKVLRFDRKFATPVYSDGELISVVANSKTEFECQIGDFTYKIHALREKPKSIPVYKKRTWKSISDFVNLNYINSNMSNYIKELDLLVLVIDPNKLGELSPIEEMQIKKLINTRLHGHGTVMQMCRSVCFECKIHDGRKTIYAGIYDLVNSVPVTSVMVYNHNLSQSMDDNENQKYENLWEYAQNLYNEKI